MKQSITYKLKFIFFSLKQDILIKLMWLVNNIMCHNHNYEFQSEY